MKSVLLLAAACLLASPAFAAQTISVAPFSAVDATDGAYVVVRHGASQQVTVLKGSTEHARIEVRDGTLHIDPCVGWHCPVWREKAFEVEVTAPSIAAIEASDGATIEAKGPFPSQPDLAVKATDGGNIDARAIAAANVNAKASDGGNLRIQPRQTMKAHADDGGAIEYSGDPTVTSLVSDDGGSVSQED